MAADWAIEAPARYRAAPSQARPGTCAREDMP